VETEDSEGETKENKGTPGRTGGIPPVNVPRM